MKTESVSCQTLTVFFMKEGWKHLDTQHLPNSLNMQVNLLWNVSSATVEFGTNSYRFDEESINTKNTRLHCKNIYRQTNKVSSIYTVLN